MANKDKPLKDDLSQIIAGYMNRLDGGETIDKQQFLDEHPHLRDDLEQYFEDVDLIENFAGPTAADQMPVIKEEDRETYTFKEGVDTGSMVKKTQPEKKDILQGTFGRYKIEKVLGEGAMGAVYLATDTELHRKVALKVPKIKDDGMQEELLERFYREARSAATLRHRGICPVYDVGMIDGQHYIAMAYISGAPLSDYVKLGKKISLRNIAMIIRKTSMALEAAHKQGIVHRDLKPANIMVDEDKEPVVMDFGLARQEQNEDASRLTTAGTIMGSPAYMSPEQVSGDIDTIGPQSDIYNLGVILYELLTGRVPFKGTIMAIIGQIISEEPKKPSTFRDDVDADLEAICQKMMAKKTDVRYQSAQEVTKALTIYLKQQKKKKKPSTGKKNVEPDETINQPTASFPVLNEESLQTLPPKRKPGKKQKPSKQPRTLLQKIKNIPPRTKLIAVAVLFMGVLLAGIVLTFWSSEGTVVVKLDKGVRDDVKIKMSGNGKVVIADKNNNWKIDVDAGEYQVEIDGGNDQFSLDKDKVTIVRNKIEIVQVIITKQVAAVSPKTNTNKNSTTKNKATITPTDGPVNLIPLVDIKKDVVNGNWKMNPNGSFDLIGGAKSGLVQLPISIKGSYKLTYELTIQAGMYDVSFIVPVGSKQAHVVRGSHANNRAGLGTIDGKRHDGNPTTRRGMGFKKNQKQKLTITVRPSQTKARITADLDGKEFVNWFGNISQLGLIAEHGLPDETVPGLAILQRDIIFHKITLEMIDGEAKLLRPGDAGKLQPATKPTKPDYDNIATGKWIDLFKKYPPRNIGGTKNHKDGLLILVNHQQDFTQVNGKNMILRGKVQVRPNGISALKLRINGVGKYYSAVINTQDKSKVRFSLGSVSPQEEKHWKQISKAVVPSEKLILDNESFVEVAFSVIGNRLTMYINGKKLVTATDDHFKGGAVGLESSSGGGQFKDMQLMHLDDMSTSADIDRKVAKWVLSLGGKVTTTDDKISSLLKLPKQPFKITEIYLTAHKNFKAKDLEQLAQLTNLKSLHIENAGIKENEFVHLKGLQQLETLTLERSRGRNKRITAVGLEHVTALKNLKELHLMFVAVTDADIVPLTKMTNLQILRLSEAKITNKGLIPLQKMTSLTQLGLYGASNISDEGLKTIGKMKKLYALYLQKTNVTDAGLKHLKDLKELRNLWVTKTAVTPEGITNCKNKYLPNCQILQR